MFAISVLAGLTVYVLFSHCLKYYFPALFWKQYANDIGKYKL